MVSKQRVRDLIRLIEQQNGNKMTPKQLEELLHTIFEYPIMLFMFGCGILERIWRWFDGKKTVLGGIFFVANDYLVIPITTHYYGSVPPDLEFWLKTIASLLVVLGVAHKGQKLKSKGKLK